MLHIFFQATALVVVLSISFWTGVYVAEKNRYDLLVSPDDESDAVVASSAGAEGCCPNIFDAGTATGNMDWLGQGFKAPNELASWLEAKWMSSKRLLRPKDAAACYARVFNAQAKRWGKEAKCKRALVAVAVPDDGSIKADAWAELLPHAEVFELRGVVGTITKLSPETKLWPVGRKGSPILASSIEREKFMIVVDALSRTFNQALELLQSLAPVWSKTAVHFVEGLNPDHAWDLRRYMGGQYMLTECPLEKGLWAVSWLQSSHVSYAIQGLPFPSPPMLPASELIGTSVRTSKELAEWMAVREQRFGGFVEGLMCPGKTKCQGGDRFSGKWHNYGKCYARVVLSLASHWEDLFNCGLVPQVGEVGILAGSGLATWSELFPGARVHGFDLNLSVVISKMPFLKQQNAFAAENMDLHPWDQMGSMSPNRRLLQKLTQGSEFVIAIDDGAHTLKTARMTFDTFKSYMATYGAYIVEDEKVEHQDAMHEHLKDTPFKMTICPDHEEMWVITYKEVAPLLFRD
mmetsp:Transcript_54486/g.129887  ORF Transcript_54486/g.129887 Transcript_54486/m.129887 type:complete len:519 (-) Transcript_54486:89-1645(-)